MEGAVARNQQVFSTSVDSLKRAMKCERPSYVLNPPEGDNLGEVSKVVMSSNTKEVVDNVQRPQFALLIQPF